MQAQPNPPVRCPVSTAGVRAGLALVLLCFCLANVWAAEDRRERVLEDRRALEGDSHWIYNDLPQAFAAAAKTRKPMLVVFRCVP
jgi:hypothetical protein